MSALPDETLRRVSVFMHCCNKSSLTVQLQSQILVQIQQTAVQSQRQLAVTKSTQQAKERERKILQLTIEELNGIKGDVKVYKGVGKMYVSRTQSTAFELTKPLIRFMMTPRPVLDKELKAEEKSLTDDINSLNKKVRQTKDESVERSSLRHVLS